ncbi:hypothetical protein GYB22_04640 [bacterium]|nr:hypothetical protein [bacterium]
MIQALKIALQPHVFLILLLILGCFSCKPPHLLVKNKAKRYASSNKEHEQIDSILTYGTFVSIDSSCNRPSEFLVKLNQDHTVQMAIVESIEFRHLNELNDSTYLHFLDPEVSYYFYQKDETIHLERFEYWDSPWWNVGVSSRNYLTEEFLFRNDSLINQNDNRSTRFCRYYRLDTSLSSNFPVIENEFVSD